MMNLRTLALAAAAAGTLAAGTAALAQDAKKAEPRVEQPRDAHGEHRGQGMARMSAMRERCHGGAGQDAGGGEHKH